MEFNDFTLSPIKNGANFIPGVSLEIAHNKRNKLKFTVTKTNLDISGNMESGDKLRRQIELIGFLDHPNIQVYYDCFYEKRFIYLFLEFEENSFYSIFEEPGSLDEHSIFKIYKQIIDAVAYVHSMNIAHLDIRPESFFISRDKVIKLGYFYNAEVLEGGKKITKGYGTLNFAAPETKIMDPSYDGKAADVWACGILLLSMLKKELAVPGTSKNEIEKNFVDGRIEIPKHIDKDIRELIESMIDPDPSKRITADKVYESTWFKKHMSQ